MTSSAPCVDSHFHIWDLQRFQYPWPTQAEFEGALFRNYDLNQYEDNMKETAVKYAVFVQVLNNSPEEAHWILGQCKSFPFLKGVVAGLDLTSPKLGQTVDELSRHPQFVGARHILDFEEEDWITRQDVHTGLALLQERGLTYDLLVRPQHLKYVPAVLSKFPQLKVVVNHIAKPYIKDQVIDGWREDMARIAAFPNVYCKISGLVGEADLVHWKPADFLPYVKHIVDIFGVDRCMFGSDWPVCTVASATYRRVYELARGLLDYLPAADQDKIFGLNAIKFYSLQI